MLCLNCKTGSDDSDVYCWDGVKTSDPLVSKRKIELIQTLDLDPALESPSKHRSWMSCLDLLCFVHSDLNWALWVFRNVWECLEMWARGNWARNSRILHQKHKLQQLRKKFHWKEEWGRRILTDMNILSCSDDRRHRTTTDDVFMSSPQ